MYRTAHFLFFSFAGRESGKGAVFSLIRIHISQESGGLLQYDYYISLLSGRQLDKTEIFFSASPPSKHFYLTSQFELVLIIFRACMHACVRFFCFLLLNIICV